MSARKGKRRVGLLQYRRLHAAFIWRSAEDIAWDNMAPIGREFGSPDYDRLMLEDRENKTGVFTPGLAEFLRKNGKKSLALGRLKDVLHIPEDFDAPLPPDDQL